MELGYTIPLQRKVRLRGLPAGASPAPVNSWDLHCIQLKGRSCLLAVHCRSRWTAVVYDVSPFQWEQLPRLLPEWIAQSLRAGGLQESLVEACTKGEPTLTKTHGRREVAFLNRAWEDVMAWDMAIVPDTQAQPLLERAVNSLLCGCAACKTKGTALEFIMRECSPAEKDRL